MPPPKGRAGNICIWIVSILLFLSILSGGALLIVYIALPESEATIWFPAAGMILVAVPWLFWIMTCFYRSMTSRGETAAEGVLMRPPTAAAGGGTATTIAPGVVDSPVDSPGGRRRVHFGAATVVNKQEAAGSDGKPPDGEAAEGSSRATAASDASHNEGSSLGSHESEMPLALSMSRQ